jgi:tryptophan-rich sensory protein
MQSSHTKPRSFILLAVFIIAVVGVGVLIGAANLPGAWYQGLSKPPFNPPNWLFGPAWTVLYVLIAIAGWRVFTVEPGGLAFKVWIVQMLLNWSWSPVSFTLHALWPAFAIIVALWLAIAAFILHTRKSDQVSACLFLPYLLWVSFAALLNISLAVLN